MFQDYKITALRLISLNETFIYDYPYLEEHSYQFSQKSDKLEISALLGFSGALEFPIVAQYFFAGSSEAGPKES